MISATSDILLGRYREKDLPFVPGMVIRYGALYNYFALYDIKNIANAGWHLATNEEWQQLGRIYGGTDSSIYFLVYPNSVGGNLKQTGFINWSAPNAGATNVSQFNGVGSGYRNEAGLFSNIMLNSFYFSYVNSTTSFMEHCLGFFDGSLYFGLLGNNLKNMASSARLVRDSTSLSHGQTSTYIGNDGTIYRTICIGIKEWLAENLCETKFRDGTIIPIVTDNTAWATLTTGAMCYYNNDINNAFAYTTEPTAILDKYLGRLRQRSKGYTPGMVDLLLGAYRQNEFRVPFNALLNEDGTPMLDENGNYILLEN